MEPWRFHVLLGRKIIWEIHTTLYRVCCIENIWLFVNAQCYAALYISYSKCIILAFKQFDSPKPKLFLKNIWKHIHIFPFTHFDSMKPIHLLKTNEKMCISVSNLYMKIINNNTLNTTIQRLVWIDQYVFKSCIGFMLSNCVNEKNMYMFSCVFQK